MDCYAHTGSCTKILAVGKIRLFTAALLGLSLNGMRAFSPPPSTSVTESNQAFELPSCSASHRSGRRIVSGFEMIEFRVPRFARMTKTTDIDYVDYYVLYGPEREKIWLRIMLGPLAGGSSPPQDLNDTSIQWAQRTWECGASRINGKEWRGSDANGRRWRHIAIPLCGFAAYRNVPAKAAKYFDKILDSMCCGKCTPCYGPK